MNGERRAFAARLNEVCTDRQLPTGRGRQTILARKFKVTPQAARKWLEGEGYPSIDVAREIAKWGKVSFDWLMSGRGSKILYAAEGDPAIEHVIVQMRAMEPEQRYLLSRMADTIVQPDKPSDPDGPKTKECGKEIGPGVTR